MKLTKNMWEPYTPYNLQTTNMDLFLSWRLKS